MADNIEPTPDETDETPEVEAHSSVLDLQGGEEDPGVAGGSCVSVLSVVLSE